MDYNAELPDGWRQYLPEIFEAVGDKSKIFQIKEKFGGLRVYHSSDDADVEALDKIEEKCDHTCANCGLYSVEKVACTNLGGWIIVLCGECETKMRK